MILISTGHNPHKKGASFGNTTEYDEGVLWSARVISLLCTKTDEEVRYVPTGSLEDKVKFINSQEEKITCAVEIHFNSEPSQQAKGSEVLYYPGSEKGRYLAQCIMHEFRVKDIFEPYRGAKEGKHHSGAPLKFLKDTKCVSVIIEPEFIFNIETINENFEKGCRAIADGIMSYCRKECKKSHKPQAVTLSTIKPTVMVEPTKKNTIFRRIKELFD